MPTTSKLRQPSHWFYGASVYALTKSLPQKFRATIYAMEDVADLMQDPLVFGDFDDLDNLPGIPGKKPTATLKNLRSKLTLVKNVFTNFATAIKGTKNDLSNKLDKALTQLGELTSFANAIEVKFGTLDTTVNNMATKLTEHDAEYAGIQAHMEVLNDKIDEVSSVQVGSSSGNNAIAAALKPVPYAGTEKDVAVDDFLNAASDYADALRLPDSKYWAVMSNTLTSGAARDLLLSSKALIESVPLPERRSKIATLLRQRFGVAETNKVFQARIKLRALTQKNRTALQYFRELDGLRVAIPDLTNSELCFAAVQGLDPDVERQVTVQLGLGCTDFDAIQKAAVAADANMRKTNDKRTALQNDIREAVTGKKRQYNSNNGPGNNGRSNGSSGQGYSGQGSAGQGSSKDAARPFRKPMTLNVNALQQKIESSGGRFWPEAERKRLIAEGKCLHCLEKGHKSMECPKKQQSK